MCAASFEASALLGFEQRSDCVHCGIEPTCDITADIFERANASKRGIKLGGKPGAVAAQLMQLGRERLPLGIDLAATLNHGGQRVKRERKALASRIDGARLGHGHKNIQPFVSLEATKIRRATKRLGREALR